MLTRCTDGEAQLGPAEQDVARGKIKILANRANNRGDIRSATLGNAKDTPEIGIHGLNAEHSREAGLRIKIDEQDSALELSLRPAGVKHGRVLPTPPF